MAGPSVGVWGFGSFVGGGGVLGPSVFFGVVAGPSVFSTIFKRKITFTDNSKLH